MTITRLLSIAVTAAFFLGFSVNAEDSGSVYEIRNYHIDPELIEEYEAWAREDGLPYIREHIDVVGFWVAAGIDAEVSGSPIDELGSANVTWIIRWGSKAERDEQMKEVFSGPVWEEIFAKVPGGGQSYKRIEAKFFKEL